MCYEILKGHRDLNFVRIKEIMKSASISLQPPKMCPISRTKPFDLAGY